MFPDVEAELKDWLRECREMNATVSDIAIRTRAKGIAKKKGISEDKFKANVGWVENFKQSNKVKKGLWQGEEIKAPEEYLIEDEADAISAVVAC